MSAPYIDMLGKKFGKLVVIHESHQDKHGNYHYDCRCECENMRVCHGGELRAGRLFACHQCQLKEVKARKVIEGIRQGNEAQDMDFIVRLEEILLSMQENERALQDLSFEFRQAMSERR